MKKIKTFIYLNYWAFILDFIGILLSSILFLFPVALLIKIPITIFILFILFKAIELHRTVGQKYRARVVLLAKNRKGIREDTFEQYMRAPCGRMLVRDVLSTLGYQSEYKELKRKFYQGFFAGNQEDDLVIIPNPNKNME